jgi:sensor histidine kinase YesM
MMPKLSGYEICQKVREQFSLFELPILILTARTHGDTTLRSLEAGANDVLHKPFDRQELLARVSTLKYLKFSTQQAIFNEVAMLQAQINPHFLHNALNALAACCYQDAEKACEAIISLSNYLRYSYDLSPETKEIPLAKELELVKAYLAVEKVRFGDRVNYDINFTDSQKVKLPPFLIQPLVENAVRHGITKKDEGGFLKIYGYRNLNYYVIGVEDNGVGISEQRLEVILSGQKSEGLGIGLSNIRQRLKKRYNTDLKIESNYGKGTKIYFEIGPFLDSELES